MSTWGPILSSFMTGGGAAVVVAYVRDRRSDKAKGAVAAGTVNIKIDEDRLSLLRQSQDAEREVWKATHAHQQAELAEARQEITEKDRKIAELVRLVEDLRAESDVWQKKLASVEVQLARLAPPPEET